jgi:hypothetical protein
MSGYGSRFGAKRSLKVDIGFADLRLAVLSQ